MALAERIAELRRSRDESLQDVADKVGVTKTHIWELERGRTKNPSLSVIQGLADHFGVSIASLVDEDIDADDADQQLAKMFRLAADLEPEERRTVDDMIQSFLRRKKERAANRS
ncbi:helix-turn-helix domain-containing protein [Mesorhizobium sp. M1423]|uniref:helix-turn-helix domain-containing protein n=1 Tax=Mesorhizobium sp. M1423 TaxID=2957101 RepID=UPI003337A865